MTVRQLLSAMLRRWYVPLAILACAALVTVMLARDGGIYSTRTVVSFMRPSSMSLSPDNGTNDSSVIAFAASVAQDVNNGRAPARYSMEDAPYYGAGVREGVLVELANSGNQWVAAVTTAEIEIHIVGRTAGWVEAKQDELVQKVLGIAELQQAAVSPAEHISATVVPLTSQIYHVAASRTSQVAAGGAMLAVAVIISTWGSVIVDRLLSRRRMAADTTVPDSSGRIGEGSTS